MTNRAARKSYDKLLKKARERLKPAKMQSALRAAISGVPGITDDDCGNILLQLWNRKAQFKQIGQVKDFKAQTIAWATRQAKLVVTLRELLQQPHPFKCDLLFTELPNYAGEVNADALGAWAKFVMQREADAIAAVPEWIRRYRKLVYKSIWEILGGCLDLGVGGYEPVIEFPDGSTSRLWHPVVEEVASEVWFWMFQNAYDLATSPVPIPARLWFKARRQAINWRGKRLENLRQFVSQTTLDEQRRAIEKLIADIDRTCLTESQSILIAEVESTDLDDVREVERVLLNFDMNYDARAEEERNSWTPIPPTEETVEDDEAPGELEALAIAA